MVDRHSFPHYPRYYCTACDNLLTAEAEYNHTGLRKHITASDDAAHQDRSGSSTSAPITTTGTATDYVEPIWKTEADSETEQLIYLALLRYPHLSIKPTLAQGGKNTSIEELLSIPNKTISEIFFKSPSIVRLRARGAYEYANDRFTRSIENVTVDPKRRLIHKKVRTLARNTNGCSIKPNGGFKLPTISASDIAEHFNEKQLPSGKPETATISTATTTSPEEVQNILQNTAIEPQLPEARHHAIIIAAREPNITRKEAATKASNKLEQEISLNQVDSVTNRRAWRSFDSSKLPQLIYDPETVARDFYAVLQDTNLDPPASIEEHIPNETTSSTTESPSPNPTSTTEANHAQQSSQRPDGGSKTASNADDEPSIAYSLTTTSKDTTDDIATLIQTTLADTTADSDAAKAALNVYEQLPKPTRQAILTNIRTETTDEIFTSLTKRL